MTVLSGAVVVVTRPQAQAAPLADMISHAGGNAIVFPSLEIEGIKADAALKQTLGHLEQFDMAIFISANAVVFGTHLIKEAGAEPPPQLILAAVGKRTATELKAHWHRPVLQPADGYNSEQLLLLQELQQVAGKRIIIFRGQGGRELLAQSLSDRGAQVDYAEVYARHRPNVTLKALTQLPQVDLITATSNESLQNLYDMATQEERPWLLSRPLVVISERTAAQARALGFNADITIAAEAGDEGLYNAILTWWGQHHG